MSKPNIAPLLAPSAWTASEMARSDVWVYRLTDDDVAELESALGAVRARGLGIPAIGKADFPLPRFGATLAGILHELESGRGFVLIRGLPLARFSEADASLIYWGIGMHFGGPVAQNAMGDVLGHVVDLSRDYQNDHAARGYQTRSYLPFHCDQGNVVGLLCYHPAKAGGLSCIASSVAIHNEILARRPDLAEALYQPFHIDARAEEAAGTAPYFIEPMFQLHRGRPFFQHGRTYVKSGQRFREVPRLTPLQVEALDMVDALAASDAFRLDMDFRQGDMQFLNNHVTLHSRTAYEDHGEPERKRRLLRLWLMTPGYAAAMPPSLAPRYRVIEHWRANPRPQASAAA